MNYFLNIVLSDEDFLLFEVFFGIYTERGEENIKKNRMIWAFSIAVVALVCFTIGGSFWSALNFVLVYSVLGVLNILFFKKSLKKRITKNCKRMLETEVGIYDRASVLEFYEDRLIERTPAKTTEELYSRIRAVYVIPDKAIYLRNGLGSAYIIPVSQLRMQADEKSFIEFISRRCGSLEYVDIK